MEDKMEKGKYHHQIPRVYLKAWGESPYVYYKDKQEGRFRNINNEFGVNYFYAIRPGDSFVRPESLDQFFSRLDSYTVIYEEDHDGQVEDILLDTKEKMNRYWNKSKDWIIKDENGNTITRRDKNVLLTAISQETDNFIEDAWSRQFENLWNKVIQIVKNRLWDIHKKVPQYLAYEDKQTLIEYYMMFDWRKPSGPKRVRESFEKIMSLMPEGFADYPSMQNGHPDDKTLGDVFWHMLLNQNFFELFNNKGMIQTYCDAYLEETTFEFFLDPKERLITSDNPCFEYINSDGKIEPLFVALPGLLIQIATKDPEKPLEYNIFELAETDVDRYNRIIFENGNRIIAKDEKAIIDILAK